MPDLIVCVQCGQAVPAAAPGGQCPGCLLRLGLASTSRADETPITDRSRSAPTKEFTDEAATKEALGLEHGTVTAPSDDERTTAPGGPILAGRAVQFGNYELHEEIGRGGMGVVFRAVQAIARREVAVKVLLGGVAGEALHGGRFAAEVSALGLVRHPNIVTVYEVGEVNGSAFFSMEFIPNGTLATRLKTGALSLTEVAVLIGKLADATEAAHQLGVLHRDIKPGNVLIAADGEPKLSDFGLAKWVNRDDALTASGAVMGTPSYMPPEQARNAKDVGPTADVYALGATLYECLTGRPPFRGPDAYAIMQRVLTQEPDAPRTIRPDIPADLEAVCLKCLDKDPTKRYASAQDFAADLTRWRNGESTVARPLTRGQRLKRRIRKYWVPLVASLILALGGGGTTFAVAWFDPERQVDRAMRNDDRVTLIGSTGSPKWHRWAVGSGKFPQTEPNLPFQLAADEHAFLELAKDTYTENFRFGAEFRVELSTDINSWGGIYVGWRRGTVTDTGTVSRAVVARHRVNRKDTDEVKKDPIEVQDMLIVTNAEYPQGFTQISNVSGQLTNETIAERHGGIDRPWRYLEIESRRDGMTFLWRERSGELVSIRPMGWKTDVIPTRTFDRLTATHEGLVKKRFPDLMPGPPPFQPRGAIGIYAVNGTVAFRNVVFERLVEVPNP